VTDPLECVAFLLVRDGRVLAERRKLTKTLLPGAVALPGGHVEAGESLDEALHREVREELGIAPLGVRYVCTLLHADRELRRLHYFAVERWEGALAPHEADALLWIPFDALHALDVDVDRTAVQAYLRGRP